MITLLLQGICIAVFTIASGFIFIEFKAKFNRSILYFGISILLLDAFSAIDLWKEPTNTDVYWTSIQHIIFCFFPPLTILYLSIFLKNSYKRKTYILFASSTALSVMFTANFMFKTINGYFEPTLVYLIFFMPYLLVSIILVLYIIFNKHDDLSESEVKIIHAHRAGFLFLTLCGLFDLYRLLFNANLFLNIMSFTLLGVLFMAVLLEIKFGIYIIEMLKENDKKHEELALAYKELEEARTLGELGKSSAVINHEIRNYTATISGYAELILMKGGLEDRFKGMAEKIIKSVKNLQSFSNDILDFSKAKILQEMQPVNLSERIHKTIKLSFMDNLNSFDTSDLSNDIVIQGDWQKLEHVFMNLFRNAFQAGAETIKIKAIESDSTILLSISDDGPGISEGDPQEIFKAFYSTKGRKGTGLGLPITRSIVEGHGGHINVVSKNQTKKGDHGLIFNLAFPNYTETRDDTGTIDFSILLIRKNTPNFEEVIRIFRNIFINPEILGDINDLKKSIAPSEKITVLGGADSIGEMNVLYKGQKGYTIVDNPTKGLFVVGNEDGLYNGPFDEEFILNHLVQKKN